MSRFIRQLGGALFLCVVATWAMSSHALAQELDPRAYSPSPVGTTFYLVGFGKSDGGVMLDPSLDIENVDADFWFVTAGAGHTFDLFGWQARILAVLPYVQGDIAASVGGTPQQGDLTGFGDPRIKFSIGLFGLPALSLEEFASRKKDNAIGA